MRDNNANINRGADHNYTHSDNKTTINAANFDSLELPLPNSDQSDMLFGGADRIKWTGVTHKRLRKRYNSIPTNKQPVHLKKHSNPPEKRKQQQYKTQQVQNKK